MSPLLHIDSLSFGFGERKILDQISFSLNPGEIRVIAGRSGSGKSVLLKLIAGLLKPDAGAVFFQGEKLHGDFVKKGIAAGGKFSMVFQEGALLDEITVWENIGITLLENGPVPASQVFSLAEKVALQTGLQKDDLQKYVWQLSGGMRKKVAIARAVFHQPQLILYDEPTAGLDPASADMIDQLIRDIRQRTGAAALVVTHDLHSIRALADQVVLLDSGKIVFEGDPATFLSSQNPVLVKFTGTRNL